LFAFVFICAYCYAKANKKLGEENSVKKVQIGARVSQEDVEFISQLKIEGAHTPSDKLRAIIENARKNAEYCYDYTGSYRFIKNELSPIQEYIKQAENSQGIHSTVVERILEWMPDFYAYCMSNLNPEENDNDLAGFERGASEKLFRLFESLLQLELSQQQTSYSQGLMADHFASIKALMKIISTTTKKEEG
jgi:hypothetical protein